MFMGDDLCSYDRSKKSGHIKEKSREKGEGDGKSDPEEKSEEGCGESPLTACAIVMLHKQQDFNLMLNIVEGKLSAWIPRTDFCASFFFSPFLWLSLWLS
ncbi:MAG: hypothetical protein J6A57_03630, partial [Ruminococcus sp.]|nr:hypothetical protein [Ruminococcus sp.]